MEASRKEYHYGPASSPSMNQSEYWLTIRPKSADEKKAVLGLKFECLLKAEGFPEGVNRVLLDQDVNIPLGKMLFIGFSSKDSSLRKTVNFLAAYIQYIGSLENRPGPSTPTTKRNIPLFMVYRGHENRR
ncbi:MAG: hypothetical protein WCB96_12495 [Candidatus Aminicenantales bacterium]